jgi:uncharacterized membrane protein
MADIVANGVLEPPRQGLVTLTHVMYAMHGFSAIMGIVTPAFVVTAFLTGWPSIIAVILNYIKRDEVRGSYLDSHFSWQLRTFWYAFLWVVVAGLLILSFIGIPLAYVVAIGTGIWVLYRIIRGWLALVDRRPIHRRRS